MPDHKQKNRPASFAHKYTESIMREAFSAQLTNPLPAHYTLGYVLAPLGYETPRALVFDPVSDNSQTTLVQMIEQVMSDLKDAYKDNPQKLQSLLQKERFLFPVTEGCKIFGIPRMHWVTLCYEPEKNCATLIDSRPWYVSFLYSKQAMISSLKKGVASLFGEEKAQEMHFETHYQGVQHNDIHCGAWTARNIMDLATENITLLEQLTKYRANDEYKIMQKNCPPGKKIVPRPLNWFSRLLAYFGLVTQEYNLLDARPTLYTSKSPSPYSTGQNTPQNQYSPKKASTSESRKSFTLFNGTEVFEHYVEKKNSESVNCKINNSLL